MLLCSRSRFDVRDGALVADFRDAVRPLVWRMELAQVQSAVFTVTQNGALWELGLEDSKNGFTPVAEFESKKAAYRALRQLAAGLQRRSAARRWLSWGSGIVVLVFLYVVWSAFSSGGGLTVGAAGRGGQPQGQSLSADDVLRAPGQ